MKAMQQDLRKIRPHGFELKLERTAYMFIAPAAVLLLVFNILPMLASFWVSTQKMGVDIYGAEYIGLDNYVKAFSDRRFIQSFWINIRYTLIEVPLQMIIGVIFSALLAKNTTFNKLMRGIYFLPVVTSAVTVGVTWQLTLHSNIGIFTYWLKLLLGTNVNLLNDQATALYVVIFIAIWRTFGISTVILVAAIQKVPQDHYEAAELDGAGKIRQFWSITLPDIMPSFWFLMITRFIGSLQIFDLIYTLTNGGPNKSTTTMVVYIFDTAFNKMNKMGYATAMSEVLFLMILVISIAQYIIMNKTSD